MFWWVFKLVLSGFGVGKGTLSGLWCGLLESLRPVGSLGGLGGYSVPVACFEVANGFSVGVFVPVHSFLVYVHFERCHPCEF